MKQSRHYKQIKKGGNMESFMNCISVFIQKTGVILTNVWGQILLIFAAIFSFFQPEAVCFFVVLGAVVCDLVWGILAAIKCRKFILSRAIRETIKKTGIYASCLCFVFLIEFITHESGSFIGIKIVAALATACELWSMSASMLIIKPDMPFLRIFRLQLKGEIESKTGRNMDHILNDELKEKKYETKR